MKSKLGHGVASFVGCLLLKEVLFQSRPYAFMKFFTINGVKIKVLGKLKMA